MRFFKEPTIQKRFTMVLILVITVILSLISAIFIIGEKRAIELDLRAQLADATALARKSLSSALWQYNYDYVDDFVGSLFLYRDIVFAQVLAGNDTVNIKIAPGYAGMTFEDFSTSRQFISQSAAIHYQDFEIGNIHLSMSRERVLRAVAKDTGVMLVLLVFIVAAIFLTVFYLSRNHIFKPLADLETSARLIAGGDMDTPIEIRGRDEISQLAAAFKQMIVNLKTITASKQELNHEIHERMRAEYAMRMERDRAQTYLDIAGVMLVAIDNNQKVTLINRRGCEILGRQEQDILGRNWFDHFIDAADTNAIKSVFSRMLTGEAGLVKYYENYVIPRIGPPRLMAWHNTLLKDKQGQVIGTLSSGEDITERRLAENQLRASLEEKEVLLREIHHRVKNNLQMVQSLLHLQADQMANPKFRQSLVESNNRIKSMALIHETLYRSKDIARLNIESYFQDLVSNLKRIYHRTDLDVDLRLEIEKLSLDLDTSIACGLIVNELATNAFKYAFTDRYQGRLDIRLQRLDRGQAQLSIQDDGRGLPQGFGIEKCASLGLRLVAMMAEDQLHGSLHSATRSGAVFQIRFPFTEQPRRETA